MSDSLRRVELSFEDGERFVARTGAGGELTLDGENDDAQSPMEALLSAVGACMGIDVALILEKMRLPTRGMRIVVEGNRADDHPRRFETLHFRFHLPEGVPEDKAERAVQLSHEKYCSVFHTLRTDLEVTTSIEIG